MRPDVAEERLASPFVRETEAKTKHLEALRNEHSEVQDLRLSATLTDLRCGRSMPKRRSSSIRCCGQPHAARACGENRRCACGTTGALAAPWLHQGSTKLLRPLLLTRGRGTIPGPKATRQAVRQRDEIPPKGMRQHARAAEDAQDQSGKNRSTNEKQGNSYKGRKRIPCNGLCHAIQLTHRCPRGTGRAIAARALLHLSENLNKDAAWS